MNSLVRVISHEFISKSYYSEVGTSANCVSLIKTEPDELKEATGGTRPRPTNVLLDETFQSSCKGMDIIGE